MRAHWQTVAAQEAAHRSCRRWTCEREKRQRCICVGKSPPRRTKGVANTALDIGTFAVAELAAACKEQLRTGATNVNTDATKIVGRGSVPSIYPYRGCVLYSITGLGTRQGLPPVRAARAASRVPAAAWSGAPLRLAPNFAMQLHGARAPVVRCVTCATCA